MLDAAATMTGRAWIRRDLSYNDRVLCCQCLEQNWAKGTYSKERIVWPKTLMQKGSVGWLLNYRTYTWDLRVWNVFWEGALMENVQNMFYTFQTMSWNQKWVMNVQYPPGPLQCLDSQTCCSREPTSTTETTQKQTPWWTLEVQKTAWMEGPQTGSAIWFLKPWYFSAAGTEAKTLWSRSHESSQ